MDYEQLLIDLRDGKIDEIAITPETFPAFQKIWRDFTSQNRIRGVAGKQGNIKYVRAN
ncbi:hypothetical protein KII95_03665 [Leuconostoc gelidum subsp. aenigmaticum]|jgi:hypothetical protein|uniref:Uncharacterized protein n=1 Tax=Leuconostoc gelidum subsp. gelidum TaxID=1607839 RepID=A0AB35FYK0_LEUGE|nr:MULTISPECIES: hypothetical protein [Leuconostoc]MBR2276816.1 hypothetical protein [Leuconostoc sp.]AFS40053.1 hypothetical protein C269_03050 [Leuconostoc gelidum JB7]MBZ5952140.1 hypothetical protein [Leuconostoc gasicomitatum]MBZ5964437.1 hypothetical protein [Leuconostoc gelidum subsp. gelidum]MBZ5968307.1 hypothetical protein [Leuconostoc gasicomitatum]